MASFSKGYEQQDCAGEKMTKAYETVRLTSESLCAPLENEDYCIQSMPDVSPAKWHLAHTTWFFEQFILQRFVSDYVPHHSSYNYLFNSYYNTVGPQHCRASRGMLSRPTVREIYDYRHAIDRHMCDLLASADPRDEASLQSLVLVGLNHEQQHQELIVTDIKHVFSSNPLLPRYRKPMSDHAILMQQPPARWLTFDGGIYLIGQKSDRNFSYDNERPQHKVYLNRFSLASRLVTNAEYLAFIEDGGYQKPRYWLSSGWATIQNENWQQPLYWYRDPARKNRWMQYTLNGPMELALNEPVCHLSYFEADAYARWADARLPSEAEWEVAANGGTMTGSFLEAQRFHPAAMAPPLVTDEAPPALQQMFGEVWQWTHSAYAAYPGYRPLEGALGEYNAKFMCNQYVLRGGSCATPRDHFRKTYRNFFPPDARWQFTGLRLARDA